MMLTRCFLGFFCGWLFSISTLIAAPIEQQKSPDVRVIIDISGSMKLNDPENLRRPALDLLVRLFPEQTKAGVWTFGQWVNMLVKHDTVDEAWRQKALAAAQQINSVALYTNIPDALSKATDDIDNLDLNDDKHIILLTDGMVDISKSAQQNAAAREKILKEILPKLADAGFTIHTIALSKNADKELMERLAVETGGLTAVAHSAEDLTKIFLQAFDTAAPAEQVPLEGNGFIVDSSIEEFTALIFRKSGSDDAILVSPDQQQYRHDKPTPDISWHRTDSYDLITVKSPFEGEWQLIADLEPDSRVTIVSNLSLIVNRLAASMFVGGDTEISALIEEQGKTLKKPEILNLINMQVNIQRRDDGKQWQYSLSKLNPAPVDGLFSGELTMLQEAGVYDIVVRADGKTFSRERKQTVAVRETLQITQTSSDDAVPTHQVTLFAQNPNIDTESSNVLARVKRPDGSSSLKAVKVIDVRTWQLQLKGVEQSGYYQVSFEATGQYNNGSQFDVSTEPVTVEHKVAGSPLAKPAPAEPAEQPQAPEASAEAAEQLPPTEPPIEPPTESVTDGPEPDPQAPVADQDPGIDWMQIATYAGIALANIVAIGLAYMAYKMVTDTGKSNALDDDDEDEESEENSDAKQDATKQKTDSTQVKTAPAPNLDDLDDMSEMGEGDGLDDVVDLGDIEEADADLLDLSETEQDQAVATDDILDLPDDAIDIDPEK